MDLLLAAFSCSLATLSLCLLYEAEPYFLRDKCFCALASLLEYASMNLLFGIIVPSDSVNKFSIPTSIPIDLDISNVSIDSFNDSYSNKLAKAQKHLSRKKHGSASYNKQRLNVAKLQEKIANSN